MRHAYTPNMIDKSDDMAAIMRKYGEHYYRNPRAHAEAARLWSITCNECGVITDITKVIEVSHKGYHAKITLCKTAKGYWFEGISLMMPISGFGYAPSVWSNAAFVNEDAAELYALDYLIKRATASTDHPSSDSARSVFLKKLEGAKAPQLCLF